MDEPQHPASAPAGTVIITLPAEIDYTNAGQVSQQISAAFTPAATTVIADLTHTTFCDTAGLREIIQGHRLAAATGTQFRLVLPSGPLTRIFSLTGLYRILAIFPSLNAAITGAPEEQTPAPVPTTPTQTTTPAPKTGSPLTQTPAPGVPAPAAQTATPPHTAGTPAEAAPVAPATPATPPATPATPDEGTISG